MSFSGNSLTGREKPCITTEEMFHDSRLKCCKLLVGDIQVGKKKAAKKADATGDDRVPRKERYTSQRLGGVLERVREQATRMSALARALDDAKIESIVVDGHAMLIRGLNQIENFLDNASRAVREAKTARETL